MKPIELKRKLTNKLSEIMPESEAQSELDFLLREHFGLDRKELILNPQKVLAYEAELENIVKERTSTRKPLQYIINKAAFLDDIYFVDESVLIPRPETEILVKEVAKYANSTSKILDIGTGSGCIAISLAKLLKNDSITSCDISKNALKTAEKNAKRLCPERQINFIQSDLFENINGEFDLIVSNPPYIDKSLEKSMQIEVSGYEPRNALFADDEGMYFYKKIAEEAPKFLKKDGILAFEAGINQAKKIENLLYCRGFKKIIIIPDLSSIDRVVLGIYN